MGYELVTGSVERRIKDAMSNVTKKHTHTVLLFAGREGAASWSRP